MNTTLKLALFVGGSLSLFAGTFVGVAALSGAPMNEVAVIGGLFGPPEDMPRENFPEVVERETPERSGQEALERQAGVLGVFTMPSPFNAAELRKLESELLSKFRENRAISDELRARELELDEWEKTIQEKYRELAEMRTKLEDLESSLELRFAELEQAEAAERSREAAGWKAMAAVYAGAEPETAAAMLGEERPEDAGLILKELEAEQVAEILTIIQPASRRKEIMDAYRAVNEAP